MPFDRTPFVLLDYARPGGTATLFRHAVRFIRADRPGEVRPALADSRAAVAQGLHVVGYLGYQAGHALEPRLDRLAGEAPAPLLWFGLFAKAEPLAADALAAWLGDPAGAWAGPPVPRLDRTDYADAFNRTQGLIAAGDIYQVNLSFRATVRVMGPPPALFARLRRAAAAGWGALLFDGEQWLLSCSPESFFRLEGDRLEARPMKGTAKRGGSAAEDSLLAARLATDPKERAENLMIVDLLRNDLARVARPGSVAVPELFAVERYPTVQQLVSTVTATLAPGRDAVDTLEALFPCGSITGAPKVRAMEVIDMVEADARGVYTGSIGWMAPDGSARFNVAIRTLRWEDGADEAVLGLGSAVVADSTADGEWRECLAKGAFVTSGQSTPDLLETMRFDPEEGLIELERHIARLGASAHAFGFRFDRHGVRNELHTATFRLTRPSRVRLRLSPTGAAAVETDELPPPAAPLSVRVVPLPVDPEDLRLRHKTGDRAFYNDARKQAGTAEVVFRRPDGLLTEGSFTNLFVRRGDRLLTPPLRLGLQPGILRQCLVDEGRAEEAELREADLAGGFLLGNMVRGLMEASLA